MERDSMIFFLCDDNIDTINSCADIIKQLSAKHDIDCKLNTYTDGKLLISDYEKYGFGGVLFLDINMPEIDGISVAEKLQSKGYKGEIIFLTVSKEHFLPAFDVGAFNYLIKGETSVKRFEQVFMKAVETSMNKMRECILVSSAGKHRSIPIKDISYFEVYDRIITVYYSNGNTDESFSFFSSLGKIENQLIGRDFIRPHRSYLVALPMIESLTSKQLILRNGVEIPVSRKNYQAAKSALDCYTNK